MPQNTKAGGNSYADGITVTEEYELFGRQTPLWYNLFCTEECIKLYMEK